MIGWGSFQFIKFLSLGIKKDYHRVAAAADHKHNNQERRVISKHPVKKWIKPDKLNKKSRVSRVIR